MTNTQITQFYLSARSDQYSSTGVQAFREELERKNIRLMASQTFTQNSKDVSSKVKTVVDTGCKVRRNEEEGKGKERISGTTECTLTPHYTALHHTTPHYR